MSFRIKGMAFRLVLYSRFEAVAGGIAPRQEVEREMPNEPTMSFRIKDLDFQIVLYSRFEVVAGGGAERQEVETEKTEPTNPQCPLESRTWLSSWYAIPVSRSRPEALREGPLAPLRST